MLLPSKRAATYWLYIIFNTHTTHVYISPVKTKVA